MQTLLPVKCDATVYMRIWQNAPVLWKNHVCEHKSIDHVYLTSIILPLDRVVASHQQFLALVIWDSSLLKTMDMSLKMTAAKNGRN